MSARQNGDSVMAKLVTAGGSREAPPVEADQHADQAAQDEVSARPDRDDASEAMRRALEEDMDRREGVYRRLAD